MHILSLENKAFSLTNLPDELEDDIRFAILDNSDPKEPDFFFIPLIFLESFSAPAMVMEINGNEIMMPVDWSIAVGDSSTGNDIEILPLTSINDRGFESFLFNPLTSFKTDFGKIEITNFYNDVKWYFPKLKQGQILAIPLELGEKPRCIYAAKEINRQNEIVDISKAW